MSRGEGGRKRRDSEQRECEKGAAVAQLLKDGEDGVSGGSMHGTLKCDTEYNPEQRREVW